MINEGACREKRHAELVSRGFKPSRMPLAHSNREKIHQIVDEHLGPSHLGSQAILMQVSLVLKSGWQLRIGITVTDFVCSSQRDHER